MCVAYNYSKPKPEKFGVKAPQFDDSREYVIKPSNDAPIVWNDPETGKRSMELFKFGMVPEWTKSEDDINHYRYCNARDDKLLESRMWKPRIQNKRCLIPANGFFEPHSLKKEIMLAGAHKKSSSVPFYFHLKSAEQFAFAGIYDHWENKNTGELIMSYSIITGEPNNQIRKIHNKRPRQPVILSEEDYDFWLDPDVNPKDYFKENIFAPWPDEDMENFQVTKQFDYGERSEKAIQPVDNPIDLDNPEGTQKSLF